MGIDLTPREFDMLSTLDKQMPEAMLELGIKTGTYRSLYYRLSKKVRAKTRVAIVIKALRDGLITLDAFDTWSEP